MRPVRSHERLAAQGLGVRFYTDKPCPTCGCTQRYSVNGSCVGCTKRKALARYATPEGNASQKARSLERGRLQRAARDAQAQAESDGR